MDADSAAPAPTPRSVAAPTPIGAGRSAAPDFARGLMLLLIAVANVPYFLIGQAHGTGAHTSDGSLADRIVQTVAIIGIDGRVYPMFAFLFGYGLVQMYTRQLAAGTDPRAARRILQRRHLWMIVFGFVHAALLWFGDILGAYGIVGLLAVWLLLAQSDRIVAVCVGGLLAIPTLLAATTIAAALFGPDAPLDGAGPDSSGGPYAINDTTGYVAAMAARVQGWVEYSIPSALLGCLVPAAALLLVPAAALLGMIAARHRLLERTAEYSSLLTRLAVVGLAVGWGTGALLAVQNLTTRGTIPDDSVWQPLHSLGGLFAGIGYIAAFGLIAARAERSRAGAGASAVQALGKRSLSGYLFQSLIFSPLLAAWGWGLGRYLSEWSAALIAVAVWAVSVAIAVAAERAHRRGPAEWLLRRLSYPRGAS